MQSQSLLYIGSSAQDSTEHPWVDPQLHVCFPAGELDLGTVMEVPFMTGKGPQAAGMQHVDRKLVRFLASKLAAVALQIIDH